MNRATPEELFNASPNQTGNNWEASNIGNMGFQFEDKANNINPFWRIIEDGGFKIWYDAWYSTLDNIGFHKPFLMTAVYPAQTVQQALSSYIQCNASGGMWLSGPADLNKDVPAGWSIDGNAKSTSRRSWTQTWSRNYSFAPFIKVLESGNNQPFSANSKWEKIVFYIERQVTDSSSNVGYEWLRTRGNIKPQNQVMYVDGFIGNSSTVNTVKNNKPGSLKTGTGFCVDFDWNGTGHPTHIKLEFIASGQPSVPVRYHSIATRTYSKNSIRVDFMREFFDSTFVSTYLKPDAQYSLKITPVYRIQDNFGTWHDFTYSNVSKTISNFVSYDPQPSENGLQCTLKLNGNPINDSTFGIVRDYDLTSKSITISYNNNTTNGTADRFIARLYGGGPTVFFPEENSVHTMGSTLTLPMSTISVPGASAFYTLEIEFWNSKYPDHTTTTRISNFISSRVQPMFAPNNVYWSSDAGNTWSTANEIVGVYRSDKIKLKWDFNKTTNGTYGLSNMMQIKLEDIDDSSNYIYIWRGAANYSKKGTDPTKPHNISLRQPPTECEFTLNDVGADLIGKNLKITLTPYFCYKYTMNPVTTYVYSTEEKIISDYVKFDMGLSDLVMIAPSSEDAMWFWSEDSDTEKSLFRIAFVLPEDLNTNYGIDKDTYEYSSLKITYIGKDMEEVERTYSIGDNSTEYVSTYICVSGDGTLSHKNSVIIDLTDILNSDYDPLEPIEDTLEDNTTDCYYIVNVLVTSKFGSEKLNTYVIHLKDLPLQLADAENGIPSGTIITPGNMSKFLETRDIVATYTDKSVSKKPVQGEPIKYVDLSYMVDPINALYNKTKNWNNVKKYVMPRAIGSDGTPGIDAPYYNGTSKEFTDHIYAISNNSTSLAQLVSVPADYTEKFNKYFQQPLGKYNYTFRSTNGNVPVVGDSGLPLYSGSEFNVSWSYFLLYWCLHTKEVLADYYLMQSTLIYTNSDSQAYGGWITIPDLELKTTYTYEIDAELNSSTPSRLWTIAGGSYQYTPDDRGYKYRGLFLVVDGETGKLRMELAGQQSSDDCPPLDIVEGRHTYTLHGSDITPSMNQVWTTDTYGSVDDGYIYVDDMELYTDYTFEITGSFDKHFGRCYTVIGGTGATNTEGLFVCEDGNNGNFLNLQTGIQYNTGVISNEDIRPYIDTLHTFVLPGNGTHTQATSGGFYIMNGRDSVNDEPFVPAYTYIAPFVYDCGTVQEIKIKDADSNVVADFIPEAYEGVSGVRDLVSNKFYPATKPDRIYVSQEERTYTGFMLFAPKDYSLSDGKILGAYKMVDALYGNYGKFYKLSIYDENLNLLKAFVPKMQNGNLGVVDLVDNIFYPCNDDDKFYMYREGQAPLSLFMLGNPNEEDVPEDVEDEEEP